MDATGSARQEDRSGDQACFFSAIYELRFNIITGAPRHSPRGDQETPTLRGRFPAARQCIRKGEKKERDSNLIKGVWSLQMARSSANYLSLSPGWSPRRSRREGRGCRRTSMLLQLQKFFVVFAKEGTCWGPGSEIRGGRRPLYFHYGYYCTPSDSQVFQLQVSWLQPFSHLSLS